MELSIGSIRCVELLSGDDAAEVLGAKYPKARDLKKEAELAAAAEKDGHGSKTGGSGGVSEGVN